MFFVLFWVFFFFPPVCDYSQLSVMQRHRRDATAVQSRTWALFTIIKAANVVTANQHALYGKTASVESDFGA